MHAPLRELFLWIKLSYKKYLQTRIVIIIIDKLDFFCYNYVKRNLIYYSLINLIVFYLSLKKKA